MTEEKSQSNVQMVDNTQGAWKPRQVLLFSGHMVDAPNRPIPRFPLDKVPIAEVEIAKTLDQLEIGPEDLTLTQGASGGDLIFAEACQSRGVKLQLMQSFQEEEFVERSVASSEGDWCSRYYAVKAKLTQPILLLPDEQLRAENSDLFERCNLWLLHTSLA